MNPRNFLGLIALFVVLILGMVVVGNLLNALVPLIVTAIIAFILGRLSIHFNLLEFIRSARLPKLAQKPAAAPKAAETPAVKTTTAASKAAEAPAAKSTSAVPKAAPEKDGLPQREVNPELLLDPSFEIKTPEEIEAEARLREQEALKHAASGDVNAALEERRKRLLGNKGEGG